MLFYRNFATFGNGCLCLWTPVLLHGQIHLHFFEPQRYLIVFKITIFCRGKLTVIFNMLMTCENKTKMRTEVRQAGKAVGERERADFSRKVASRVENSPWFASARVIALYSALPDEIDTSFLLDRWSGIKRLALPAVEYGHMVFREYIGRGDLIQGEFGIMEPYMGRIMSPEDIDIMIVPGVAFDRKGRRLGRGKGFYDKYLSSYNASHIRKVGVCMPHQVVDKIPHTYYDVPMDEVICPL